MTRHEHESENSLTKDEVRAVIIALHERMGLSDPVEEAQAADEVTVTDIAEAVGLSTSDVENALRRIRGSREAELAKVLRELEEPLYRVERPGFAPPDPLSRHIPWRAQELNSSILNDVPKPVIRTVRGKLKKKEDEAHEKVSNWIAVVILGLFGLLMVLVIVYAVIQAVR